MSVAQSVYDWLGRKLEKSSIAKSAAMADAARIGFTMNALEICSSYIASAISKADFLVYKDGKRVEHSWDEYVWGVSPNVGDTRAAFIGKIVRRAMLDGYAVVLSRNGSLYVADSAQRLYESAYAEPTYNSLMVNGCSAEQSVRASDVFVFEPGYDVRGIVDSMAAAYDHLLASSKSEFVDKHARKFKLKLSSTKSGTADQAQKVDEYINNALRSFVSSDSGVLPEYQGYDLQPFNTNALVGASTDFIALRKDCFESVATAMRMPVSILYGNVNNFDAVFRSFVTMCVRPFADMMAREITRKMYAWGKWKTGWKVVIDMSTLKHYDLFDAADAADKLVASSVFSPNDVRAAVGCDPVDEPWANKHYITKNYADADSVPSAGEDG